MAKDRTQRRRVRDQHVIEHVAEKLFDPQARVDEQPQLDATTESGLPVEKQVRKEWNPKKRGLPTFLLK